MASGQSPRYHWTVKRPSLNIFQSELQEDRKGFLSFLLKAIPKERDRERYGYVKVIYFAVKATFLFRSF